MACSISAFILSRRMIIQLCKKKILSLPGPALYLEMFECDKLLVLSFYESTKRYAAIGAQPCLLKTRIARLHF